MGLSRISHNAALKSTKYLISLDIAMIKPSNIAILLKIIKDNQNIDNISIIKNNKGYFK